MSLLIFYASLALGLSFVCSILEAVLLSTTYSYIQALSKRNQAAANRLKNLKENMDKSISSILTLNTFANTLGAAGVGAQAMKLFGNEYMVIASVILTIAILYFSEIVPKTIGATYWKALAPFASRVISVMIVITYPFTFLSSKLTKLISKNGQNVHSVSRDEILAITELGEKSGVVREQEGDLIENLLSLANDKVRDILTPRSVVFALQKDTTVADAVKIEDTFSRSRIPVFDANIDDVVGVVFNKRILEEEILEHSDRKIEEIMSPIFRVSENVPVLKVLDMFIHRKEHMFLVTDSYGQTAGIVTLEDAIEQLLDVDIMDEFDQVEDMQEFAKSKMKSSLKDKPIGN